MSSNNKSMITIRYNNQKRTTQRKAKIIIEDKERIDKDSTWIGFEVEGDILYNYMINNLDEMFKDESTIKHFDILDGYYPNICDTYNIRIQYGTDIQRELIQWIKEELKENRLFDKMLWKPFRDQHTFSDMYLGYRKLFWYKHYIFQLSILSTCSLDTCEYCDFSTNMYCFDNSKHFMLALYGWEKDGTIKLQPYEQVVIPKDNMMIEKHWKQN